MLQAIWKCWVASSSQPLAVGDGPGEEVPLGILAGSAAEELLGPADVAHVDGLPYLVVEAP